MTTPLRNLGTRTPQGWILVSDPESDYLDGGEQRVLEILQDSTDVSALSDELLPQAETWSERYHLSPTRANLLRALDLPTDAVALEVGAGCGAVTRYLGESCATVDALEPVPSRALAARERTRDLPGVEVFVATVEDVPAVPTYDVIVVVGVLEYVASGSANRAPYVHFLQTLAALLTPGGTLALAIENKLGVKYFCGAPEDHSDRMFDSVEGYPFGSPARTFSRHELGTLMADAGLKPAFRAAFPDYKMTRAVFDTDAFVGPTTSLLYRIPAFPSPDWQTPREAVADERMVWRSLVQAGLSGNTGNSFLVLATKDGQSRLWPADRAGAFFTTDRRAAYSARTDLVLGNGGELTLRRSLLSTGVRAENANLQVRDGESAFHRGSDLLDSIIDTDDPSTVQLLHRWRDLALAEAADGPIPLDLIPRNVLVDPDDGLVVIDQEWFSASGTPDDLLRRGALLLSVHLVVLGPLKGEWAGCSTVRDVAASIGRIVGPDWGTEWIDRAVAAEVTLQAQVSLQPGTPTAEGQLARAEEFFAEMLNRTIRSPRGFADRQHMLLARAARASDDPTETVDSLRHQLNTVRTKAHELGASYQEERELRERAAASAVAYQARASARETEFIELQLSLDRLRSNPDDAQSSIAEIAAEGEHQRSIAAGARGELERMKATISWRITAPLRRVRSRLGQR